MSIRISFKWLKRYMPRSLYGRAALILLLPMLTVQLTVSVVFIQRHFEGVTEQMTNTMVLDLQYLLDNINDAPNLVSARLMAAKVADPLELEFVLPVISDPVVDSRRWYDLSGQVVVQILTTRLDGVQNVILTDNRRVDVWVDTKHGVMEINFPRRRVSASNPHQLLVWMGVLGAFMTLISFSFLRNQLRPITRLSAASNEYGRGRIVPYQPAGANEVRLAGHAFLDMRNRIERQTQSRTMMLSGVSHDLRTPLTRLRLGLGLLDEEDVAPMIRDVDDMQHLLDTFLDFARGDSEGDAETVDPLVLGRIILADARRMNQAVSEGVMSGEGTIALRPQAIRRAVENLIGNALRYGAEAQLSIILSPRAVIFRVEDDGPGIPVDERENAVRPFTRLDPARNQDRGSGVGLGLSIVEDIARAHGGTLRLGESPDLGGLMAEIILAR